MTEKERASRAQTRRVLLIRLKRLEDTIRLARSDMTYIRKLIAELEAGEQ
jgi:hypothetical protein